MPLNKVSVDRLYQKTGSPNEKKERYVKQIADDIFADLFSTSSRKQHAQKQKGTFSRQPAAQLGVVALLFLTVFGMACGEPTMGAKEEQAIRLVKGYSLGDGYFSITSNVDEKARDANLSGNVWSQKTWTAGLHSQTDRIVNALSQYFNIFEAPSDRWVRLTYSDNQGLHEAVWNVDIYSKQVVPKDEMAKEFTTPANMQRAELPKHLTGPGSWAGGD